jgi:hypothetical protein
MTNHHLINRLYVRSHLPEHYYQYTERYYLKPGLHHLN